MGVEARLQGVKKKGTVAKGVCGPSEGCFNVLCTGGGGVGSH